MKQAYARDRESKSGSERPLAAKALWLDFYDLYGENKDKEVKELLADLKKRFEAIGRPKEN